MKQCPQCQQVFEETIAYCPKDNARLQYRSRTDSVLGGRTLVNAQPLDPEPATPWEAEPEEPDLVGHVLVNRFRVVRRLGEGGMGVVYAAEDTKMEKEVAIKVLREDFAHRSEVVARFEQEAKAAGRIRHENVLNVYDWGKTEDGKFYIVMDLLVGTDLADVLQKQTVIEPNRGLDIVIQVCRALGAAHGRGIIHRDLKPENVFLVRSDDGREVVKIVDFGIAQMRDISGSDGGAPGKKLTRTGMIFGTPEYMSPEQAAGKPIDQRVDIYAVGVILYEMFAGRVPFVGETFMGVLMQHISAAPPAVREVNPQSPITPDLEAVIYKALRKDPAERYASMGELAEDLVRARNGERTSAPAIVYGPVSNAPITPAPAGPFPSARPSFVSPPVGVSRTIETEAPRASRKLAVAGAAGVVALGAVVAFAMSAASTAPAPVPEPTARHPVARPTPRTNAGDPGAGTANPRVAPVPVPVPTVADAGVAMARLQVRTDDNAQGVTVTATDPHEASRVVFTCRTPCSEQVAAGTSLRLSATAGRRSGTSAVESATDGQAVVIAMRPAARPTRPPTTGRPNGTGPANGNGNGRNPGQRRCGTTDEQGLLIPCFGENQ